MANIMIRRTGYDEDTDTYEHATEKVVLSDAYSAHTPLAPGDVVTVSDADAEELLRRLPWQLEITQLPATREVFDKRAAVPTYTSIFDPLQDEEPVTLTRRQEAEVNRRVREAERLMAQAKLEEMSAARLTADDVPPPPMTDAEERQAALETRKGRGGKTGKKTNGTA